MNFHSMPVEILSIIFYIHINVHFEARRTLLLTCRAWRNFVLRCPLLWTAISWNKYTRAVHVDDTCRTLAELARNIGRTKQTTFDLTLQCPTQPPDAEEIQAFTVNVDKNWLFRCRSLTVSSTVDLRTDPIQALLLSLYPCLLPVYSNIGAVLHPGEREFPTLELPGINTADDFVRGPYDLDLLIEGWTSPIAGYIFRHADILRRIRRLTLGNISVPWDLFCNLKHLDYTISQAALPMLDAFDSEQDPFDDADLMLPDGTQYQWPGSPNFDEEDSNLEELVAPGLTSLCLEGSFEYLPTHAIFIQLKHLVLRNFSLVHLDDATAFPSHFPRLSSLAIQSPTAARALALIQAENLEKLMLSTLKRPERYLSFANATLTPRTLRLVLPSLKPECEYTTFGNPLPISVHVEELNLTLNDEETQIIGPRLHYALHEGTQPSHVSIWLSPMLRECYPKLQTLTVVYPYAKNAPSESTKRDAVKALRALLVMREKMRCVIEARGESGFQCLETVEVGWYCTRGFEYILGRPSTEWQVTEWKDCLEDWNPQGHFDD